MSYPVRVALRRVASMTNPYQTGNREKANVPSVIDRRGVRFAHGEPFEDLHFDRVEASVLKGDILFLRLTTGDVYLLESNAWERLLVGPRISDDHGHLKRHGKSEARCEVNGEAISRFPRVD